MKSRLIIFISASVLAVALLGNCKSMMRAAAKYWTKKQIKEFLNNCENSAIGKFGEKQGKDFCGCAVDVLAEQYHNYDDVKDINFLKILAAAKDCAKGKM